MGISIEKVDGRDYWLRAYRWSRFVTAILQEFQTEIIYSGKSGCVFLLELFKNSNSKRKLLTTSTAAPPAEQGTQKKPSPRTAATRKWRHKRPTNGDQPDYETSRLSSHSRLVEKHQVADPHLRTAILQSTRIWSIAERAQVAEALSIFN